MAKRDRSVRRGDGRGTGRGVDYTPYTLIQDIASQGLAGRIKGWTTGRVHHLPSQLEQRYFYLLDWSPTVVDIREHFPMRLDETVAIAESLGIRHPTDRRTGDPVVMTTDVLITVRRPVGTADCARTICYAKDLSARALEKLEIERVYWSEQRQTDWGIVTDRDIDMVVARNIEWLHAYRDAACLAPLDEKIIHRVEGVLAPFVNAGRPLRDAAKECDERLSLPVGSSLGVVRHLLASQRWHADLREPINPAHPLKLQTADVPR